MNARGKGLLYCREVRRILEACGHKVEGPGYGIAWVKGTYRPIHKDFFGGFDLMSYYKGEIRGHQVSTLHNRAEKRKHLEQLGLDGWVWCRTKEKNRVKYRVFNGEMEIPMD